jgi:hypothetical protein
MTDDTHLESGIAATDSLRVRTWNVAELEDRVPDWHERSKRDRIRLLKTGTIAPEADDTHRNTTTNHLHEQLLGGLIDGNVQTIGRLALGDDWGGGSEPSDSAFARSDETLNNVITSFDVPDAALDGRTWLADVLIGSLEFRNTTFREWGLTDAGTPLFNHGPIYDGSGPLEKGDREAILLTATLTFGDVSEASGGSL